jgi:hypothetical protein
VWREAVEKRPAQNTLKELKTLWDTEEAIEARAQKALAQTALDVTLAEVLCVCATADGEPLCGLFAQRPEPIEEFVVLERAAEVLNEFSGPDTIWVGHNIAGFDLPILLNRWRRHRITPPEHFPAYSGRWMGRVFDSMLRIPTKTGFISLNEACARYGIPMQKDTIWQGEPMTGARVGEAFEAGEYALIAEYCMADVEMVGELYSVMTFGGTRGTYDTSDAVAEHVSEIEASELSPAQKALAIVAILDASGRIPRA